MKHGNVKLILFPAFLLDVTNELMTNDLDYKYFNEVYKVIVSIDNKIKSIGQEITTKRVFLIFVCLNSKNTFSFYSILKLEKFNFSTRNL